MFCLRENSDRGITSTGALLIALSLAFAIPTAAQTPPYPPPGKLIDVGGYRVHLYCTGTGKPSVIITGAGFSFDWGRVQPEVAKFATVCTYDPSGMAWSDAGNGSTCANRVDEIHRMLTSAGMRGPHILVGLSIGAVFARLYASQYPKEVTGMVLVDHAFLPARAKVQSSAILSQTPIHLSIEDDPNFKKLPARNQELHRWADALRRDRPEVRDVDACVASADAAEKQPYPLGSMPLVVVSTGNSSPGYAMLQSRLLALSRRSRQLISTESYHPVHIDEPGLIVRAIRRVVEMTREPQAKD